MTLFSEIFTAIMSLAFTIFAARIGVKLARIDKKADERHKETVDREVLMHTLRTDEAVVVLELVSAVKNKRCNGELKKATDQFEESKRKYDAFVCTQASKRLAENK
jgi:hypothetical protein